MTDHLEELLELEAAWPEETGAAREPALERMVWMAPAGGGENAAPESRTREDLSWLDRETWTVEETQRKAAPWVGEHAGPVQERGTDLESDSEGRRKTRRILETDFPEARSAAQGKEVRTERPGGAVRSALPGLLRQVRRVEYSQSPELTRCLRWEETARSAPPLDLETLDRQVQRDARRYDGGLSMY